MREVLRKYIAMEIIQEYVTVFEKMDQMAHNKMLDILVRG